MKIFLIFAGILFLLLLISKKLVLQDSIVHDKTLVELSDEVLSKCSKETHHQSCYDKEIPNLMDAPVNLSMEDAFAITRLVQENDKSFPYCHVLGHNLSAKEVKKDPSRWKEVVSRCPSGVCSNGCIHGGFQERFRAESLDDSQIEAVKPDLKTICEKRSNFNPTGLEQASCYHALGHLTMYLTSANTQKSVKLCEEIAVKDDGRDFLQVCLDGVFMQIYQPLEPEDFALISGKEIGKSEVDVFCNTFLSLPRASCISESWPLFRNEILNKPSELIKLCSKEEKTEQDRCFNGMFYVLVAQFNFDLSRIKNYCLSLPEDLAGKCFTGSATRFVETDYKNAAASVELCSAGNSEVSKDECFIELVKFSSYNFHAGSEEFLGFCLSLPDPWQNKCLNENEKNN